MSLLDEALVRQLKKLRGIPEVKVAAEAPINTIRRQIHLEYTQGSSDKEYNVEIIGSTHEGFEVKFSYGRRGKTLIEGTKTTRTVGLSEAIRIYDKLVDEKLRKGYKVM